MRVDEVVHLPELSLGACGLGGKPGVVVDVIEGPVAKHEAKVVPELLCESTDHGFGPVSYSTERETLLRCPVLIGAPSIYIGRLTASGARADAEAPERGIHEQSLD
jgi:hypothetical protein